MNKIIIPTGYMGSGSSAITDLISEFRGYEATNGSFEYVFMHCPGGVFDLEDKLLVGNNAVRSDEALHTFYRTMNELYSDRLWWPANYKKWIGREFIQYTNEYVEDLIQYKPETYWYMQEKFTLPIFMKMCIRKVVSFATGGKVLLDKPLTHKPMWISYIDAEDFYKKTRKYLNKIFKRLGAEEKNLVLDQLILPFNLHRMKHYFGDNVECFVVERDPRDVFIANKYVWAKMGDPVPYPMDAKEFCKFYKQLRMMEKPCDHIHVHRIAFEDLIYHYNETVKRVMDILDLEEKDHIKKRKYLNPKKSINNTQMFLNAEYADEIKIIEEELAEYLYEFPCKREPTMKKSF